MVKMILPEWKEKIFNLDWKKYNDTLYNSVSFNYFPKEQLDIDLIGETDVFYKSDVFKIVYVPIYKNASTSIKNSLNFEPVYIKPKKEKVFDIDIPEQYRDYKFFTIIRDPKSRWISGINEFINIYQDLGVDFDGDIKGSRKKFLLELKNNKFIFDGHTRPQLSSIDFCFKYDIDLTLIKMDERLEEKISTFIKDPIKLRHDNPIEKYKFKLENYNFCYQILNRYCMKNTSFLDLYSLDFYLYNNSF